MTTDRYCIIGAGPAGLLAARSFRAAGIPYEELIQRLLNLAQRYPAGWKAAPPSAAVLD